jgi:DNA modification methylase
VISLHHGDCLEVMPTLPDGCADMILCDLPYGTTACKWDSVIPFEPLWEQYRRLIKPNGAIVLFGSQPFTSALVMSKPAWFRYQWVWEKSGVTGFLDANRKPMKCHEDIAVFYAAAPTYNPQMTPTKRTVVKRVGSALHYGSHVRVTSDNNGQAYPRSVIYCNGETGLHPTQKPVALLAYFIRTYTNKGETVLDNCAGSGSTGEAAFEEGRNSILIERDAEYFVVMRKRLEEVQTRPRTIRMELDPAPL